ncbi:S-adenosyl-L-methionine-dependent methyltransferase [Polyplosphaeria fusca]|uniref:rRNA adenine N(6)-methyltransferase n=1 Tax=Polyplosphaeria fusca TaxID=682080 RepID=A0A9P4R750_9PLEO|nr:S-adenosyl-L-methionine-dependent methyltransferase [Polyplosphaeria fusca]
MYSIIQCRIAPSSGFLKLRALHRRVHGSAPTQKAASRRKATASDPKAPEQSEGKLKPSGTYPLSEQLHNLGRGLGETKAEYTKTPSQFLKTQIVSPDLCDDVLKYIGPSLDKHKGCDIVDLNPGAGLWSQKLHEYLQPRSHILVEPAWDKYGTFLQPLLDAPNSTYKLAKLDPCEYESLEDIPKYLEHQEQIPAGHPRPLEPNDSVLVTGCLMWDPQLPGYGSSSMARQVLFHFSQMAQARKTMHAFGPARMLFWTPTDVSKTVLARSSSTMGKLDFFIKRGADVREVVTAMHARRVQGKGALGREPRYELESVVKAMQRGKEQGMELPEHRRAPIHEFADDVARLSGGTGILNGTEIRQYLKEQELAGKDTTGLLSDYYREGFHVEAANPDTSTCANLGSKEKDSRRKASRTKSNVKKTEKDVKVRDDIVDIGEAVYWKEVEILGMTDGEPKEDAMEDLEIMKKNLEILIKKVSPATVQVQVRTDIDDRLTLRMPGRRIPWDLRPYEPLVMQAEEVWPANRTSLLDIQPFSVPPNQDEQDDILDYITDFITGLLSNGHKPLPEALEIMENGASELIEQVPILKDPSKGGRLDMSAFKAKMLTPEMLEALFWAYREWPFRNPESNYAKYFQRKGQMQ